MSAGYDVVSDTVHIDHLNATIRRLAGIDRGAREVPIAAVYRSLSASAGLGTRRTEETRHD